VNSRVYRNCKLYRITFNTPFSFNIGGYPADQVYVQLFGTRKSASTPLRVLAVPQRPGSDNRLLRAIPELQPDVFVIPYPDVGDVSSVQIHVIHHEWGPSDHDATWTLDKVEVTDLIGGGHWCFCNGDGKSANIYLPIDQWYDITFWPPSVVWPGTTSPCR
jgi:hypothetical protein